MNETLVNNPWSLTGARPGPGPNRDIVSTTRIALFVRTWTACLAPIVTSSAQSGAPFSCRNGRRAWPDPDIVTTSQLNPPMYARPRLRGLADPRHLPGKCQASAWHVPGYKTTVPGAVVLVPGSRLRILRIPGISQANARQVPVEKPYHRLRNPVRCLDGGKCLARARLQGHCPRG